VRVLVSGASIAGTAVAYWLGRQGYSVTVVERHPGLRPGGQAIDVRGPALAVLDRMGLLAAAEDRKMRSRGASFVDRDGNELSRDTESTPTGGLIDNPDIEILRDDLVELLYRATLPTTEYLFDDSVAAVRADGASVEVTFERSTTQTFDLVIGADGLHSNVRRLAFGPEEDSSSGWAFTSRSSRCLISLGWNTGRSGTPETPRWPASTASATTLRRVRC
jgi:2-polyprenyl-6-methoxyphenol hydroxylase-like FAD-dependent oxidoreductase